MPIENKAFSSPENQEVENIIDLFATNTVDAFNDIIENMSREEISAEIDKTFNEFPDNDQFIKWIMFDYLYNIVKPKIMDSHFGKDEFISSLNEFSESHGPTLHRYLEEKVNILDQDKNDIDWINNHMS